MVRAAAKKKQPAKSLEQRLWDAADALRGNQEPSEYKHVVLGLVFLKYISDRFATRRAELETELVADGIPADRLADFLEARDEYTSHNVFWVPADARWDAIQARAKLPTIGTDIDTAYGFEGTFVESAEFVTADGDKCPRYRTDSVSSN